MSLALATHIPVRAWLEEEEETVLTAFQLLDEQAEETEQHGS